MACIALFDILGFRNIVRSIPLETLVALMAVGDQALSASVREPHPREMRALATGPYRSSEEFFREYARASGARCRFATFSDTVLLYRKEESVTALRDVMLAANRTLSTFMALGVPLRGAVTIGPLHADPTANVYLGKGLVDAYEIEQKQDWAGAVLDAGILTSKSRRNLVQKLQAEGILMPYAAPMKSGKVETKPCLGWPLGMALSPEETYARLTSIAKPEWDGERKLQATVAFHRAFLDAHRENRHHRFLQALARTSRA